MTTREILGLAASYIYAIALILLAEGLRRRLGVPQELTRKLVHIGAGMWVFGILALLLAVIGIYALLSYAVTQRKQELGIRMALGANRVDVLKLVLRQGMMLALLGEVVGLIGAFALTRVMRGLLFGIGPLDISTFATVVIGSTVVALAACYIPARRATKVDPLVALRYE